MRWGENKKEYIGVGDTRVITKFLIFPKCIENEWRWLEVATYKEKVIYKLFYGFHWISIKWYRKGDKPPENAQKIGLYNLYIGIKSLLK